jgi:hypothetical protein
MTAATVTWTILLAATAITLLMIGALISEEPPRDRRIPAAKPLRAALRRLSRRVTGDEKLRRLRDLSKPLPEERIQHPPGRHRANATWRTT